MIALLLALQVAASPAPGDTGAAPRAALWTQIDSVTRGFLSEWRRAWSQTQRDWPPEHVWTRGAGRDWYVGNDIRSGARRLQAVHCHFTDTPRELRDRIILSSSAAQASCPTWYPPGLPALDDERLNIDGGLERKLRPRILAQRHALRVFLEQAADSLPDDVQLSGQRVRFALDAGAMRDAWGVATAQGRGSRDRDAGAVRVAVAVLLGGTAGRPGSQQLADSSAPSESERKGRAAPCGGPMFRAVAMRSRSWKAMCRFKCETSPSISRGSHAAGTG